MGRKSPLHLKANKPADDNRFPASPRDRPGKAFSCLFLRLPPGAFLRAMRGNLRQPFLRFRSDARYNCQAFHKLCHST